MTATVARPLSLLGSVYLAHDDREVQRARHIVRAVYGAGHPALHCVEICASELITNALLHTDSDVITVVFLGAGDRVRVEVTDNGAPGRRPHIRTGQDDTTEEHGRGLLIVDALTGGHWGCRTDEPGQTTWAEIKFEEAHS